jgi:lysophospholipase L1-like esterase
MSMRLLRVPLLRRRVDLVVVGDSVTAGYGASSAEARFAARVTRFAGMPDARARTAVVGFRGACVNDLLAVRLPRPRRCAVVELGTNDWLGYNRRGASTPTPLAVFEHAYSALLSRVVPAPGTVRLVCLGVWGPGDGGNGLADVPADFDRIITSVCAARGGAFVSLTSLYRDPTCRGPAGVVTPLGVSDAVHPNDLGHERIAEMVRNALE